MKRSSRLFIVILSVATVAAAGWYVVRYSPLLVVKKISVTGVSGPLADQVRALVTVPKGTPLVVVDANTISNNIEKIPQVRTASLRRGWPNTLVVDVHERIAAAWATGVTAGVDAPVVVVDDQGVVISRLTAKPAKLVELTIRPTSPGGLAALNVFQALPDDLKVLVTKVGSRSATSIDSVTFTLKDKSVVLWGSAELMERKADVLRALLPQKADEYDVSAPDLPSTVTK